VATQQLEMRRGDTATWELTVTDKETGSVFNLTGYTVYFTVKALQDDPDPGLFQLSTVNGAITIIDAVNGTARIKARREDTSALTKDFRGFFDVQVSKDGDPDDTHTPLSGVIVILRDITRAP
jgi:hypothetical protein